ncbi:MAG: hypothetical protein GVY24_00490 [Planctomycetes bacterium]|jgi:hypothetical protein|nr:hypothetical protein [Planctomycetota bacterium]
MTAPALQLDEASPRLGHFSARAQRPARAQGEGFTSLLTKASDTARAAGKSKEQQVRESVEQLVSSAFILPLMNELRDQPLDSDLFGGGFAEDSFRQQLDTVLADRMVAGGNFPVVEVIYERLTETYRKQQEGLAASRALDVAG